MKCPLCQTEMRISRTRYKTTQEPPIKLYAVQSLVCRSKQCENYGAVVEEISHELSVNEDENENATETKNETENATEKVMQEAENE